MAKNILLITTFYPNKLRPGTPVCHYFVREWKKMGYNVLVLHYRSMFPRVYTTMAKLFPKLALKVVGNYVEQDVNQNIVSYEHEGVQVYSIPIYKYVPHGRYTNKTIKKHINIIQNILGNNNFIPDYILGHFYNPTIPLIMGLKSLYPSTKTSIVLHENHTVVIKTVLRLSSDFMRYFDLISCRNQTMMKDFIKNFGAPKNQYICYSGTPSYFIKSEYNRMFNENKHTSYIYVGQLIARKYPQSVIEALSIVYPNKDFEMTYVGEKEIMYEELIGFINRKGLSQNVNFTGKIPREDILSAYDKSDVFIMISKSEVFGLVYLEAMSRGCITIASKGEGIDGIIQHGVNGFLCEPGNVNELVSIIKYINTLSIEAKQVISNNARKTALELSDYNVASKYLEALINS